MGSSLLTSRCFFQNPFLMFLDRLPTYSIRFSLISLLPNYVVLAEDVVPFPVLI